MANVGPTNWYGNNVAYALVAAWVASHSYAPGALIRPVTFTALSERVFANVTASTSNSTSGSTEPTWTYTKGALQAIDGAVFWQEVTGQPGVNGDLASTPTWAQQHAVSTAITAGLIIQDSASGVATLWIARVGGTIGASAPAGFSTATAGASVIDNSSVTWISLGPASGFGNWAAPFARLNTAYGAGWVVTNATPPNSVYLSDNHAETQAAANSLAPPGGTQVLSYDHTVSLAGGPTTANLKAGATITTTVANALSIAFSGNSWGYVWGVTFQAGTGATNVTLGLSGSPIKLENCKLQKLGTTANGLAITTTSADLVNCTMKFGATGDAIRANVYFLRWRNDVGVAAIDNTGAIPTGLVNTAGNLTELRGLDLSAILSGGSVFGSSGSQSAANCLIASGVTAGIPNLRTPVFNDLMFTDSTGSTFIQQRSGYYGSLNAVTGVYRTGGASNGVVNYSWQITTIAGGLWVSPFEAFPLGRWNTVLNTNRVVTVYGLYNGAALPKNDEIWMDVDWLGSSSSPIASHATLTKANLLASGSALPADTVSQWNAPARVNGATYAVGAAISVSSNPGQVFFCTAITTGIAAGSLPSAYAPGGVPVADGTAGIVDGGATFRAGVRFSMSLTLSSPQPKLQGDITAQINVVGPGAVVNYFVDPFVNLA